MCYLKTEWLEIASSRWDVAMGLFIVGFISWSIATAFYAGIFPRLARSTPRSRELRERYERGEISAVVYIQKVGLEKSKISTMSMVGTLTR